MMTILFLGSLVAFLVVLVSVFPVIRGTARRSPLRDRIVMGGAVVGIAVQVVMAIVTASGVTR